MCAEFTFYFTTYSLPTHLLCTRKKAPDPCIIIIITIVIIIIVVNCSIICMLPYYPGWLVRIFNGGMETPS